jgi:hypothetical protein
MPPLSHELVVEFLQNNKIELYATQTKICFPILNCIYMKLCYGIIFPPIKVDKDKIIDGHHRYLASLLANKQIQILPYPKTSATHMVDWQNMLLVQEDWDSEEMIKKLNETDAKFNNLSFSEIIEMIK